MLGCCGDFSAVLVQGAAAREQAAGAVGAGSLGMCSGGDESASSHSPQFFWPGLPYSNIIKKDMAKDEMKEAREELEKDGVSFFPFIFYLGYLHVAYQKDAVLTHVRK